MGEKGGSRNRIKLSYVLPTHNRVEYLGECLETLVEQVYPKDEYEIIVVDDGSTDSTTELVEYFCENYKNVAYYKLDKVGVEFARNYGNERARGEIIGVCDSDDLYHPYRAKITMKFFEKHPEIDIMDGSYVEMNHQGNPLKFYKARKLRKHEFFKGTGYFCHDNCAYRTEKILKIPYRYTKDATDDWNLVTDWLKAGYKFGFTPKELCKVRTLKNGIMGSIRAERGIELPYV